MKDIKQIQEPSIGEIVKIICINNNIEEEIIGRLEGYQHNDFGQYIKLRGHSAIFAPSIQSWEILNERH